jgi:hypothetical protein
MRKETAVVEWIQALESRLGTPGEQPMDAMVVVFLVHRLKSIQCVTIMAEEYGVPEITPAPFPWK